MKMIARLFFLLLLTTHALANTIHVADSESLHKALTDSRAGDTISLKSGHYPGNFVISNSTILHCENDTVLDGQHQNNTIRVTSPNVTIQNCTIINWGDNLTDMNAGIFVENNAHFVQIKNNKMQGDTFGIWLDKVENAKVYHNKIQGNLNIRSQDRGNGIHLFATKYADIAHNTVWYTRDGIYIDTSNENKLRHNELHHLRYGVHYMYSYNNEVSDNYTHHTRTGYALMQSKFLTVTNNRSENDENYGILMNFITQSTIDGNTILRVQTGTNPTGSGTISGAEGKALFIYNSAFNTFSNNRLQQADLAIHLTAGSEDNRIFGNSFIANKQQVKYVSNRKQEWSDNQMGNYWSDYLGWDRNGDSIGDTPYEPNDSMDKLLWTYPAARLLVNSPAVETLRWIQRTFPVLKSPGVTDSFPLMKPHPPQPVLPAGQLSSHQNKNTEAAL